MQSTFKDDPDAAYIIVEVLIAVVVLFILRWVFFDNGWLEALVYSFVFAVVLQLVLLAERRFRRWRVRRKK